MTLLVLLLGPALGQAAAVPPPVAQLSADCARAVYATDQLVCADPVLLALDRRLVALLATVPEQTVGSPWVEDQEAWFRRSRLCAFQIEHAACVAGAYHERIAVLSALASAPPRLTGRCSAGYAAKIATDGNGGVELMNGDRVIAVAAPGGAAWQPFISYRRTGKDITFRRLAGTVVARCRSKEKQDDR
jgi:uncharacterized protein